MTVRDYSGEDCETLYGLFYDTVHGVNKKDYAESQLKVWARKEWEKETWHRIFQETTTKIVEHQGEILGFANLEQGGLLDKLYVHKEYQGQGVGSFLLQTLEDSRYLGVEKIGTFSSITALPFFKKRGFTVIYDNEVLRHGVALQNFYMEKELPPLGRSSL